MLNFPGPPPEAIIKGLNNEQIQAVVSTSGPVIVIAGAGVGKTTTLLRRCAMLMLSGVPPANILIVTFTNKAAQELRDRLLALLREIPGIEAEEARYVTAGTFHSVVFKNIIKQFPESKYLSMVGIDSLELSIVDTDDALKLIKQAMNELGVYDREQIEDADFKARHFFEEMSFNRAKGIDINDYLSDMDASSDPNILKIITSNVWRKYNALCRENNVIDFDDILLVAKEMLDREVNISKKLAEQFKYISLDEYQDTNAIQQFIMDSIAQHHEELFVIGDDRQSIYGWRGSDISVILGFLDRYPNARKIDMNRNYRSSKDILEYANAVASKMNQRLTDGNLIAECKIHDCMPPAIVEFETSKTEALVLAKAIKRDLSQGVPGNEIAILYRNRSIKSLLEISLVTEDIPYKVVGDTSFYQRSEVKDAIAMLKFMFNPWDTIAGLRVVRVARFGVSESSAKKGISSSGLTLLQFLQEKSKETLKGLKGKGHQKELTSCAKRLHPYLEISRHIRECSEQQAGPHFIMNNIQALWDLYFGSKLRKKSNLREGALCEESSEKVSNVYVVFDRVNEELKSGKSIQEIIEDLSMLIDMGFSYKKDDLQKVNFLTMHASKGLEFDNVYVIGVDDRCIPGSDDYDQIEEERRVFYVAITRARKKLAITFSKERQEYGKYINVKESPFIKEIEQELGVCRSYY